MRRLLISLMLIFLCVGYVFAAYPITYIQERDPQTIKSAHQAVAVPSYLQSVNYSDLIKKGYEYEKAGKWIYAYGTYIDASTISNGDTEAKDKADGILSIIASGKPGKGSFDVFTLYDKWVELIEESEKYFTEFSAYEIELRDPVRTEIHYDTRTADYEVTIYTYFTEKANNLYKSLNEGFKKVAKVDWKIKPWFLNEQQKQQTIKASNISYEDFKARTPAIDQLKFTIIKAQKEGIAIASWLNTYNSYEDDNRSTNNLYYCSQKPAFFADMYLFPKTWDNSMHFLDGYASFYDIELELCDRSGKTLAKSNRINIKKLGDNSERSYNGIGQEFTITKVLFKNMSREFISLADADAVMVKATGLYLHYGLLTVPSTDVKFTDELVSTLISKLPENKIDLSKVVIYTTKEMINKLDDANIETLLGNKPTKNNDILIYGDFYGYKNMDIRNPHFKAVANRMSIKKGLKPAHYQDLDGEKIYDSSKWVFDNIGDTNGYDSKLNALRNTWATVKTDENANGYYLDDYTGRICMRITELLPNQKKMTRERLIAEGLTVNNDVNKIVEKKEEAKKIAADKKNEEKVEKEELLKYLNENLPRMIKLPDSKFEIMENLISSELYYKVMGKEVRDHESTPYSTSIFRIFEFCNRLSELYGYDPVYKIDGETLVADEVYQITDNSNLIDRQDEINSIVSRLTINENANGFRVPSTEEFCYTYGYKMKKKPTSEGSRGDEMKLFTISKTGIQRLYFIPRTFNKDFYYGELCFYKPYFVKTIIYKTSDLNLVGFGYMTVSGRRENTMQGYDLQGQFRLARTIVK